MGFLVTAPHNDITYRILGAAMAVHNEHGPGHREEFYQRALALKFMKEPFALAYSEEYELPVYNDDSQLIYVYRVDFLVEAAVMVEIKAHHYPLNRDEMAQVLDYFAASNYDVALLINFGRARLEWQPLFPPKRIQAQRKSQRICNR